MPASFDNLKDLMFVITLGTNQTTGQQNTFDSGDNQITLQGFRSTVDIDKGGGAMFGTLRAQIWGVSQSDMNSITTLQYQALGLVASPNTVSVYTVDGLQQTLEFQGNIVMAWGNYQSQPDVFLQIQAQAAYFNQMNPIAPTSYNGPVDVATVISQLASQMGYTFENNGVSVQLSNPYFPGTGMDQVNSAARAAGIWLGIDNSILFITPPFTSRGGGTSIVPEISPQSGLIGYPSFDGAGVNFQILYNPAVKFMGLINLVTSIPRASGQWIATGVAHRLEANKPGGAWFSTIRGNFSGIAAPS